MNNDFLSFHQSLTEDLGQLEAVLLQENTLLSQAHLTPSSLQSIAEKKRRLIETIQYRLKQAQLIPTDSSSKETIIKQQLQNKLTRLPTTNHHNGLLLEARMMLNQYKLDFLAPHYLPEYYGEQGYTQPLIHKRYESKV
ncbi:hypothetical protein [Moellerella wisconsensis]|uniref:hypothetical protein n=1 Tax=Moellerella wisconsensis TaxID=158849 RepID=UPI00240F9ACC|nr:hypothetical protein [Moellerella wisconsensis]